jgi:hypothetical protein
MALKHIILRKLGIRKWLDTRGHLPIFELEFPDLDQVKKKSNIFCYGQGKLGVKSGVKSVFKFFLAFFQIIFLIVLGNGLWISFILATFFAFLSLVLTVSYIKVQKLNFRHL